MSDAMIGPLPFVPVDGHQAASTRTVGYAVVPDTSVTQHEAGELLKPAAGPGTYAGASAFGLDSVGGCRQIQHHSGN